MNHDDLSHKINTLVSEVLDAPPEKCRGFLPISTGVPIPPGTSAQITARPQVPFRGEHLAVWSVNASAFMIDSIRVGRRAVGAQAGAIPADAFATRLDFLPQLDATLKKDGVITLKLSKPAAEVCGRAISLPRAEPGMEIEFIVTNASDKPEPFAAVLFGNQDYV